MKVTVEAADPRGGMTVREIREALAGLDEDQVPVVRIVGVAQARVRSVTVER